MSGTRHAFPTLSFRSIHLAPGIRVSDGEIYRKKALHCLLTADKVRDSNVRLALLQLARNYMALADYLDKHGQDQDKQTDS
jgi:hypothetical protein